MPNRGNCPLYREDAPNNYCAVPKEWNEFSFKKMNITLGSMRRDLQCDGEGSECQNIDKTLEYLDKNRH